MKILGKVLLSAMLAGSLTVMASDDAKMDKFIDDLMSKMTLEEKLGQINLPPGSDIVTGDPQSSDIGAAIVKGQVGGTFNIKGADKVKALQELAVKKTRLGIPLLIGMDVIHGYQTVFPIPLALAASWDPSAAETTARIAAIEASAAGINWTFSPMVDIARDPRWGRMSEGSGEDPFLGSRMAEAMVRGYQGKSMQSDTEIMACLKHFALYGAPDAGRDYSTVDMSRLRMFNEYLAPYRAAVNAGVGSVMSSFNVVDGIPATANKWLLTDLLRDYWGFKGFVVTDYGSIGEMQPHGMGDMQSNAAMALKSGTDMDMSSWAFVGTLAKSLQEGKVSMADIDRAVRLILEAKYKLGLFKNPYKYNNVKREKTDIYTPEHKAEARRIAAETFVLLKNEGNILPLQKKGKIALVGPLANTAINMVGSWAVAIAPEKYKTLLQGFQDAVGDKANIIYAKGCNVYADAKTEGNVGIWNKGIRDNRTEQELFDEAMKAAANADVIVAAMGELAESSGESSSRSELDLPETQKKLLAALVATGKPVVMLNFSGRSTVMTWENDNVPAILNVWFGGSEAPDAIADVVFGDVNPSGKLPVSMPRNVGQVPVYYNHLNTGRPVDNPKGDFIKFKSNYFDVPNAPLFPFGYGLSYTSFSFSDFNLSSDKLSNDGTIRASVKVTNTGDRDGAEVVQYYIRDMVGSISRPVKELKHFERVSLAPGESKTVSFDIKVDDLKYYHPVDQFKSKSTALSSGPDIEYSAEPGEFQIMVGPDSENIQTRTFTLE